MDEQEKLTRAVGLISLWISRVELSNAIDYFDINKASEGLVRKLLNSVYGMDLRDLNKTARNFPSIDLGDDTAQVGIQVTSTVDDAKVRSTFEKFAAHQLDKRYVNGVRFFLISNREVKISRPVRRSFPKFDPSLHIIRPHDIVVKLKDLYETNKSAFDEALAVLEDALTGRQPSKKITIDESQPRPSEIPIALKDNLLGRLVGRLKLLLFSEITGDADQLPSTKDVKKFLLSIYHRQPELAQLYKDILDVQVVFPLPEVHAMEPADNTHLRYLMELPVFMPTFFETEKGGAFGEPGTLGFLVHRRPLHLDGWVYVITALDEEAFPGRVRGRFEIRASKSDPEPVLCELTGTGWAKYNRLDQATTTNAKFALSLLRKVVELKGGEFQSIEFSECAQLEFDMNDGLTPPRDAKFDELIRLVVKRKAKCTVASVRLAMLKPQDMSFCLSFPLDVIMKIRDVIAHGNYPKLLVYWSGTKFVVSDDYVTYMAYRSLEVERVPVVVMGGFPHGLAKPQESGYEEMIPPVLVWSKGELEEDNSELMYYMLDQRLSY